MQTSFMHPPFGFALFYLRSVAPAEPYIDRVTGKRMEPVTTGQIYWGAVPFVVIQCIMVGLVIAFPAMVMHYKGGGIGVDPSKVKHRNPAARPAAARSRARRNSVTAAVTKKSPERAPGPCLFRTLRSRSRVRVRIDEIVVGQFGDLPPQILVVAEGQHGCRRFS